MTVWLIAFLYGLFAVVIKVSYMIVLNGGSCMTLEIWKVFILRLIDTKILFAPELKFIIYIQKEDKKEPPQSFLPPDNLESYL